MFTMKEIVRVQSLEQAYELNQKRSNQIIGGMLWLKMQHNYIGTGIDLSDLGLDGIEETAEEFKIGCMCTLRMLEKHAGLDAAFPGLMKDCVKHIVGVQFRNSATVGGSIYGRFGFSDVLTCLLSLDCYVELYKNGVVSLKDFVQMPYDRDVLVRIIIKKDYRIVHYETLRASATDFPVVACAVARKDNTWFVSVGARPVKAAVSVITLADDDMREAGKLEETAKELATRFTYGTNLRGSREYRLAMAEVLIRRGMYSVIGGVQDAN